MAETKYFQNAKTRESRIVNYHGSCPLTGNLNRQIDRQIDSVILHTKNIVFVINQWTMSFVSRLSN